MKHSLPPSYSNAAFPKLPTYHASWHPLYFSPLPGSDETLTVALIAKGLDGCISSKVILHERMLSCLFRDASQTLDDMIRICINDAMDAFSFNLSLDGWQPPIDSFHIGKANKALGISMDSILRQAVRLSSSFGSSFITDIEEDSQTTESKNQVWVNHIKKVVKNNNKNLARLFNREIVLNNGKLTEKIGFLASYYAANFSVINPSIRSFHQAIRNAQGKLWQLDQIRDLAIIDSPTVVELILGYPNPKNALLTDDENNRINDCIDELRIEAIKRDIHIFDSSDPNPAAMHLLKRASGSH